MIGIVGGTGLMGIEHLNVHEKTWLDTPYGKPSGFIVQGDFEGQSRPLCFLARHGVPHTIPPHKINYRANIWALKSLGVEAVLAVNAVGGISENMGDGALVIPDQMIDYTYGREHTFFDGGEMQLEHVDFTSPFDAALRQKIIQAANAVHQPIITTGCCGVTQGPRLETAAEIARMARDGCDIVGMTHMPEAALAKELGIAYASIALVVNPAAGVSDKEISLEDIHKIVDQGTPKIINIIQEYTRE